MKVLVLGGGGMLGHKVAEALSDLELICPSRSEFDVRKDSIDQFELSAEDYIVNCVGAIPQKNKTIEEMFSLNTNFPKVLADLPQRVIQIATDCVYSGLQGQYSETSAKDPDSLYGAFKWLGEVQSENIMHIRCSVIGPELTFKQSLFEWVRNQAPSDTLFGYENHYWNGVTTEAFARVVRGVIKQNLFEATTQHLVPADSVSKAQLVKLIANRTGRTDLKIILQNLDRSVDRTLTTAYKERNEALWQSGGFYKIPTIAEMIEVMGV